ADRHEDDEIDAVLKAVPVDGDEATLARRNIRLLRRVFVRDLVPITVIDEDVIKAEQAKSINEILDIFDRVNSGGTRLSRSDLMFSLIKAILSPHRTPSGRVLFRKRDVLTVMAPTQTSLRDR
ncbi:MAG: hypothetical protein QOI59_4813, partial [Gammaproteobacteria bacterium]|nr:hypothetical protein [Gammaproteobacteria bacterium]